MLQYLIILLDDAATSYCHYANQRTPRLMPLETLQAAIRFGMTENLMIQFVYPDAALPQAHRDAIETIDHSKIMASTAADVAEADVVVVHGAETATAATEAVQGKPCVVRLTKAELAAHPEAVEALMDAAAHVSVVLTDAETMTDADLEAYRAALARLAEAVEARYAEGRTPQLNLLTDRMMLEKMNNCNAGWENVTLAPDGCFYVCPAFYAEGAEAVGSLADGLDVKNPQLYRLDHAPLCRRCDAYQCKRCVWLNRRTTLEVNTPSHEQCVTAHTERNAARDLLAAIRRHGAFLPDREIKEIAYLDPFDVRQEW